MDVGEQLHAFGLARDRLVLGLARSAGLSQADLHALEHIEAAGGLTPRDLQGRTGLSSGSVTALVDRLERAGWVVRSPNPADRRSVLVKLSAAALSEDERAAVAAFLARVTDAAERAGDEFWSTGP
jgi:DNA-binding MarR family transcriptional regulator